MEHGEFFQPDLGNFSTYGNDGQRRMQQPTLNAAVDVHPESIIREIHRGYPGVTGTNMDMGIVGKIDDDSEVFNIEVGDLVMRPRTEEEIDHIVKALGLDQMADWYVSRRLHTESPFAAFNGLPDFGGAAVDKLNPPFTKTDVIRNLHIAYAPMGFARSKVGMQRLADRMTTDTASGVSSLQITDLIVGGIVNFVNDTNEPLEYGQLMTWQIRDYPKVNEYDARSKRRATIPAKKAILIKSLPVFPGTGPAGASQISTQGETEGEKKKEEAMKGLGMAPGTTPEKSGATPKKTGTQPSIEQLSAMSAATAMFMKSNIIGKVVSTRVEPFAHGQLKIML
jgi:hypothetical protein